MKTFVQFKKATITELNTLNIYQMNLYHAITRYAKVQQPQKPPIP